MKINEIKTTKFKVIFQRKNKLLELNEIKETQPINLNDSLMYFKEDLISL